MRNRIIVWSVVALIVVGALAATYFQPEAEPPTVIGATPRKPRPAASDIPAEAATAAGESQSPAAPAPAAEVPTAEPREPETSVPPAAAEPRDMPAPAKRFETDLTTTPAEVPPADVVETVPPASGDTQPPLNLGGSAANSDNGSPSGSASAVEDVTQPAPASLTENSVSTDAVDPPEAQAPPDTESPPDTLRRTTPLAPGMIPSATMGKIRRYAEYVISQHDKDGDGQLSGTEWQQLSADYRLSDLDRDGVLTTSELAARIAVYSRRRAIRLMPDRGPSDQAGGLETVAEQNGGGGTLSAAERELARRQAARRFTVDQSRLPQGLPKWFTEADADGDGQVSIAELSARWSTSQLAQFLAFDLNNDGLITADECLRADRHRQEQTAAAASQAAAEALPPLSSAVEQ